MARMLRNPSVRWAVHPADQGRIKYIEGTWDGHTLPHVDEVITRPFLVDPETGLPVPVRVAQILEIPGEQFDTLAVVVAREH